jgi:hypothetical protein
VRSSRPASLAPVVALSLLAGAALLVLGSRDPYWNGDWYVESWQRYQALVQGGFGDFLTHAPTYSGFLTLVGVPVTLLVEHTVGGVGGPGPSLELVFRLTAVPGVVALVLVALVLAARARALGAPRLGWMLVIGLACGPMAFQALHFGHPEDVLAAPLCVLALLAARRGRGVAAGLLLALAVVSKQWAVLAVLPAMLAAPDLRGALRIGAIAVAGAAAVLVPIMLLTPATGHAGAALVTSGALFHPHQIWWPFGVPADPAFIAAGHGSTQAPAWLMPITHPLIVVLAFPLSALWWACAGRGERRRDDAFALLALLFLERCALDPWNLVYYHLPLVLALLAWEVHRGRDLPILALGVTVAAWLSFVSYDERTGMGPFLAYFVWVVPLAGVLLWALYGGAVRRATPLPSRAWPAPPQRPPAASPERTAPSPSSS